MRRLTAAAILVLLTVARGAAQNGDYGEGYEDSQGWFTRDKQLHFGISAIGAAGIYALGVEVGLPRWQSAASSTLLVGAAGLWREIGTTDRANLLTRQKLSRRDLVWDVLGIGFGLAATELYYRVRKRPDDKRDPLPVPAP